MIRVTAQHVPTLLVLRRQFLSTRPRSTPLTEQDLQTMPSQQCVAILHPSGGYAIMHLGEWERQPVLWIDELFLQPAARKQGLLKDFVDWIRGYCEYNGIERVMGMAFSLEEALPLKAHVPVQPVAQILAVPVSALHYQPSVVPATVTPALVAPPPKRPRKRKPDVQRLLSSEEIRLQEIQALQPIEKVWQESRALKSAKQLEQDTIPMERQNGATLPHRSGVEMPLPASPERM